MRLGCKTRTGISFRTLLFKSVNYELFKLANVVQLCHMFNVTALTYVIQTRCFPKPNQVVFLPKRNHTETEQLRAAALQRPWCFGNCDISCLAGNHILLLSTHQLFHLCQEEQPFFQYFKVVFLLSFSFFAKCFHSQVFFLNAQIENKNKNIEIESAHFCIVIHSVSCVLLKQVLFPLLKIHADQMAGC